MATGYLDFQTRRSCIQEVAYELVRDDGVGALTPARVADRLEWSLSTTRRGIGARRTLPEHAMAWVERRLRFQLNEPRPHLLVSGPRRPTAETPEWVRGLDQLLLDLPWAAHRRDDTLVVARLTHACSDEEWAIDLRAARSSTLSTLATLAMAGAEDPAPHAAAIAALARGVSEAVCDGALAPEDVIPIVRDHALGRRADLRLPTATALGIAGTG